ncbi:MAG TPA: spore germination protein GerW family protein [Anaerolineales bacterium]|nr:spore germination protein GerW family protein [Anaerolineales bacterium]
MMAEKSEAVQEEKTIDRPMASIETIRSTLNNFLEAADVSAVYGAPIKSGDTLIIPTAEVLSGMGFGMGYWGVEDQAGDSGSGLGGGGGGRVLSRPVGVVIATPDEVRVEPVSGLGGGGGGRVLSRPVAVVIATPDEVRVEPVIDFTKIALAALTASGFMMGMLMRMMKGSRDVKGS